MMHIAALVNTTLKGIVRLCKIEVITEDLDHQGDVAIGPAIPGLLAGLDPCSSRLHLDHSDCFTMVVSQGIFDHIHDVVHCIVHLIHHHPH